MICSPSGPKLRGYGTKRLRVGSNCAIGSKPACRWL
jgi:hypothetical protein